MQVETTVQCPWCHKGEVVATGGGNAAISIQCPKCKHFFRVDLTTFVVEKSLAIRRGMKKSFRLEPHKQDRVKLTP